MTEPCEPGRAARGGPGAAGEELRWDRLERLPPAAAGLADGPPLMSVLQFPNGSANLTYLLELRRPPVRRCAGRRSA